METGIKEKDAYHVACNAGGIYQKMGGNWVMANAMKILDQGSACLVEHMRVIDAEYFISIIKRDDFDYTVWQREYFDKMAVGEFAVKASAYAESHPYMGKAQVL